MFPAEGRERLQELNLAVVGIEETPDDRATIDEIFRIAHSLKGMSATTLEPPPDLGAMAQGRRVIQITATLRDDVDMPSVRASMVLAAAAKLGETLACVPAPAEVDTFDGREIVAWLVSEKTDGELHSAVVAVPDVAEAEVMEAVADAAVDGVEMAEPTAGAPSARTDSTNRSHQGASTVRVDAAVLSDGQIALIVDCDAVAEAIQPRGVLAA
jgi:hypothetical protein